VDRDSGQPEDTAGRDERSDGHQRLRSDAAQGLRSDSGPDYGDQGQRQVGQSGVDRRVSQHVLHIEGQEEEDRQEADERDQQRSSRLSQSMNKLLADYADTELGLIADFMRRCVDSGRNANDQFRANEGPNSRTMDTVGSLRLHPLTLPER
jgi:hypothetical protein